MRSPRIAPRRATAVEGRGRRISLLVSIAVVALAAVTPAANAGKTVDGLVGGPTPTAGDAGRFLQPHDVAVVEATGDFYVVEQGSGGNGRRVQRFDSDGRFELAWGRDVIEPGAPGDAGTGFEVCTTAADCKGGIVGDAAGELSGPTGIAVNQVPGHPQEGHVYVRDSGNRRVQEFDADGGFVRAWGWGVATGASLFEVCTASCLPGLAGSGDGQLGSTGAEGVSLAVDPTSGNVLVADPANRRVQEFEGDGDFVSKFGAAGSGAGQFGSGQPARVTVDSSGVVYATDSNASNRVQRYDTTTDAFLAPIGVGPLLSGVTHGIEIDPTNDRLLVVRDPSSGETIVQELDIATLTVTDTHAIGDGFGLLGPGGDVPSIFALAVDGTRGKLYMPSFFRRDLGDGVFPTVYNGVFALDADGDAAPSATAGSPLTVDDDSAVLSGTVDPNGPSFYRFEYSKNGVDWKVVSGSASSGANAVVADLQLVGSAPQPVSATIGELESNTVYRVRIVATKFTGPISEVTVISEEGTFLTDAAPPTAVTNPTHSYTDTSAWLSGKINPKGSATSYRFEWGRSTTYEHQAPAAGGSAGAGGLEKSVLEEITGLEPDTLYHYRLVAESAEGVSVGADRTFRTRSAGALAGRSYEQVTPAVKERDVAHPTQGTLILGTGGGNGYATWPVSGDGGALLWSVSDALLDAEQGGTAAGELPQFYRADRGVDGWSSRLALHRPPGPADQYRPRLFAASMDLSRFLVHGRLPLLDGADAPAVYERNLFGDRLDQIAAVDDDSNPPPFATTDDLSRVFFEMRHSDGSVQEAVGGSTRIVSVDPSGVPFPDQAVLGSSDLKNGAVSDDGEDAFFSTPVSFGAGTPQAQTAIYRRSGGATTVLASPSKLVVPDLQGPKAKVFQTASMDGDRVLFTSSEELTDDANTGPSRAGRDLYRYEVSSDTLVDISADDDADGSQVVGVLGASDDLSRVYYAARGVLASGATAGQPNVYMWQDDDTADGETRFVATLAGLDVLGDSEHDLNLGSDLKAARVSPDGRALVFHSTASLTGYRNEGFSQVFVYEADANDGDGALSCVSCRPNGTPAHGDSAVPRAFSFIRVGRDVSRALSDDGRRVFFNSADALVPQDVNGQFDVYEWEAGRLRLISTGASEVGSDFVGASADGDDVFFITRDRLVGQDTDGLKDVYDARVGGGFAAQNPVAEVPCAGEACRPAPLAVPPAGEPASKGAGGEGDYAAPFEVERLTARQRRALASGRRVVVRVDVAGPGRLVVRAVMGRRTVASGSRTVRAAGSSSVALRLSQPARRTLRRRGRLRLVLEIRFAGERESVTVRLRRVK
jgi:hypothetical protein